ncbi:MAG: glycosyltransferase family 9 protein [Pseudomonadota bacterium]
MRGSGQRGGPKVLVVKRDGLRLFIEAEPAFAAIRRAHPGATIDLVTSPQMQRLAKCAPFFDRVVATRPMTTPQDKRELAAQLKKVGYSVAYDLDGTRESMELRGMLKGFRAPTWVGPRRKLQDTKNSLKPSPLAGPGMRKLLHESGLEIEQRLPDLSWSASPDKGSANLDPSWFGVSGDFALFIPAANAAHRWPAENYAAVAAIMAQDNVTPVILGNQELGAYAYDVMQLTADMQGGQGRAAVDLSGKADAAQMSVLARHAQFFLAGPSDELHLVAAAGTPGVVLVPASEDLPSDALFGRDVVKLTASNMGNLTPDLALSTLKNMGLLRVSQGRHAFG